MKKISIPVAALFALIAIVLLFVGTNQNEKARRSKPLTKPAVAVKSIDLSQLTRKDLPINETNKDQVTQIDSVETYESLSKYGQLPPALRGTEIDGDLQVDNNGKLLLSPKIRQLFEYFLLANHEEGMQTSIGRIVEYIQLTLPPGAEQEALALLEDYLGYKNGLADIDTESFPNASDDSFADKLRQAVEERKFLRRKFMSPEAVDAFFSKEESYNEFTLNSIDIARDNSLTTEEKQEKIIDLENQLPEPMRQIRLRQRGEQELKNQIADLKKYEGTEDTIYAMRENFYDQGAADRLAEMDKKRTVWNDRFATYYQTRQSILSSTDYSEEEKNQQLYQIRLESFTEPELVDLAIYEKIRDKSEM